MAPLMLKRDVVSLNPRVRLNVVSAPSGFNFPGTLAGINGCKLVSTILRRVACCFDFGWELSAPLYLRIAELTPFAKVVFRPFLPELGRARIQ